VLTILRYCLFMFITVQLRHILCAEKLADRFSMNRISLISMPPEVYQHTDNRMYVFMLIYYLVVTVTKLVCVF